MAFLQNTPPREPIIRVPGVVLWLTGLLVTAHAARVFVAPSLSDRILDDYAFIPAHVSAAMRGATLGALFDGAVPFASYMALHENFTHIAVNSLWLIAFGPVVARRFGARLFLLFFLICGVAAAATHLAFNWGSPVPVIGASGAISGLMAAGIRILPTLAPQAAEGGLAPVLSRPVFIFTVVWVGINLFAGLTGFGTGNEVELIAWQAHLGGYFTGLLLAGPFDAQRQRAERLIP